MKAKVKDTIELVFLMFIVGMFVFLITKVLDTDAEQMPLLEDNNKILHDLISK